MKSFDQFRRELADAVTVAVNSGVVIHDGSRADLTIDCRCPLGVRTRVRHPTDVVAAPAWGISTYSALAFAEGFDGERALWLGDHAKFFQLSRLYRRRFVCRFVEGK